MRMNDGGLRQQTSLTRPYVPAFTDWLVPRRRRGARGNSSEFRSLCAVRPPGYLSPC